MTTTTIMTTNSPIAVRASAARVRGARRCRSLVTAAIVVIAGVALAGAAVAAPVPFPLAPFTGIEGIANNRSGVRSVLVYGDTIYVGGSFRVTQGTEIRNNLAAFDFKGKLKPAFVANPNGTVLALATDGKSLFVGGEFTRLDLKKRLAAVDLTTGKVNRRFTAHFSGAIDTETAVGVRALAVITDPSVQPGGPGVATRLIVGGNFTRADSAVDNRSGLAALSPETGDLDTAAFTTGVQGGFVDALLPSADGVYVGGSFTQIQARAVSLAAVGFTGILLRGTFSTDRQPVIDLTTDETGDRLFAGVGGGGNRVYAFAATGTNRGQRLWRGPQTGGDVQAVHYYGGNVYFGFHDGLFMEPDPYKLAVVDAATGLLEVDAAHQGLICDPTDLTHSNCWLPLMDNTQGQGFFGVWAISHYVDPLTSKVGLIVGGDFTQIGGLSNTRRLTIFNEP
jgi:hypothetical protein